MTRSGRLRASAEKRRPSVFWVLAAIIVPLFGIIAKVEVEGGEHVPRKGPFVVAPNHYSEIDPLVVAIAVWRIGRAPRFLAKESLFRVPVLGWALRATGMVPVARQSSTRAAKQTIETTEQLVRAGSGVIVYPEGTLTREPDLWPMRGKTGAVRLAFAGDIPIIPMAQWGAQRILPRYGKLSLWPPRKRVRVVFGPPVDLSAFAGREHSSAGQHEATDVVMGEISVLLGGLREQTPPASRWNPHEHGQSETGHFEQEN